MPDNLLKVGAEIDVSKVQSALKEFVGAVDELGSRLTTDVPKASDKAKASLGLLGELIGVHIPEQLQTFVAGLPGIGPALESAFTPIAVVALAGTLFELGTKLFDVYQNVVLLKGAEEEWNSINDTLAGKQLEIGEAIRRGVIEHVRLTKGELAGLDQEIRTLNDQPWDLANITKGLQQNKDGFKNLGEVAQSTFAKLSAFKQVKDIGASLTIINTDIKSATDGIKHLQETITEEEKLQARNGHDRNIGLDIDVIKDKRALKQLQGDVQVLQQLQKTIEDNKALFNQDLQVLDDRRSAAQEAADKSDAANAKQHAQEQKADLQQQGRDLAGQFENQLTKTKKDHLVGIEEEKNFWESKLKAAKRFPELYREINNRIAQFDQQLFREKQQNVQQFEQLLARQQAETEKVGQEQVQQALATASSRNQALVKALQDSEAEEKAHAASIRAIREQTIADNAALGKISGIEELRQLKELHASEHQEDLKARQDELKDVQASTSLSSAEKLAAIIRINTQIRALDRQFAQQDLADNQKLILAKRQQFDQFFKQISSQFNTALNGLIQGTETASQAFSKLFQSVLQDLISFVEQWIEQKIEMWLIDKLLTEKGISNETKTALSNDVTQIQGQALVASANAYAPLAADPPAALAAAAAAGSIVSGFGAVAAGLSVKSGAGGIYEVDQDQLAFIHKSESVIPASYAEGLRRLINNGVGPGGSQSVNVVVNHSVNAIDAASFQTTIKRHGNLIGNEVARVLKQKGFGGK